MVWWGFFRCSGLAHWREGEAACGWSCFPDKSEKIKTWKTGPQNFAILSFWYLLKKRTIRCWWLAACTSLAYPSRATPTLTPVLWSQSRDNEAMAGSVGLWFCSKIPSGRTAQREVCRHGECFIGVHWRHHPRRIGCHLDGVCVTPTGLYIYRYIFGELLNGERGRQNFMLCSKK